MSTNSKIFITGDCHANIDWFKLKPDYFPQGQHLTKDDFVIICGDFGGVWDNGEYDNYIQGWYNSQPWTTLFIDGNHENHNLLDSFPVSEWHGGKVHRISDKIIHLMRGQVYDIGGFTFFTMGGASSHDKQYRKENETWWARELPSIEEYEEGFRNLEAHGNKVDIILSHCPPDSVLNMFYCDYEHDKLTNYLEVVRQSVDFEKWFCGHMHRDLNFGDRYICLYNTIEELEE